MSTGYSRFCFSGIIKNIPVVAYLAGAWEKIEMKVKAWLAANQLQVTRLIDRLNPGVGVQLAVDILSM